MRVSQPVRKIVGIATAWDVLNPIVFILFLLILPWDLITFDPALFFASNLVVLGLVLLALTGVIHIALLVYYLIHVVKNAAAEESVRIVLGLGFFFMSYIAMPLYYYLYIWRESPPDWAAGEAVEPTLSEDTIAFAELPSIEELKEEEKRNAL